MSIKHIINKNDNTKAHELNIFNGQELFNYMKILLILEEIFAAKILPCF